MKNLEPDSPLSYWQVTDIIENSYDVADAPMEGEMDSTFFLTKDKNWIPHTYPCRTAYIDEVRDQEPREYPQPDWNRARNILPTGSPYLDLSGFWFRPTRIEGWARTVIVADEAGPARLRLSVCGTAKAYVNGQAAAWLAPASRNAMDQREFEADLKQGNNEISIRFEDLCERDAVIRIALHWLSGPPAQAGHSFPADRQTVEAFHKTLSSMHLDAKRYDGNEIRLVFPVSFRQDVSCTVKVGGHFMSHDHTSLSIDIPAGTQQIRIASAADLPADYRYFDFFFSAGDLTFESRLGAEISWRSTIGPAPEGLPGRIQESIDWVARHAESDTETALACAASEDADLHARGVQIIDDALSGIEQCFDCADFALVPLLWTRTVYPERLPVEMRERIDAAILNFRYWMDEPGNDVQWYFSENHALLFHTAAYLAGNLLSDADFIRSGRSGKDQSSVGRQRLIEWFDHFETAEMAEFNSATYFPIDLKGMTALFALAPDDDIRDRAGKAICRLITIIANSAHQGVITGAQGRSYEHSLCTADTLELTSIARLLWGKGSFGAHVNCLPQLALCLRDHGLKLPELWETACWTRSGEAQEWMFSQGKDGFARLYHYKTTDTAMGSAAVYRWYEWGYQETLLQARIGHEPSAQIWINHPGEIIQSGFGRPSFWGGSASIPRVQQYRNLAIVKFSGDPAQPDFTHAWFPTQDFDEWEVSDHQATARSSNGVLILTASGQLELVDKGGSAQYELRLPGRDGLWLVRLGSADDMSTFSAMHDLQYLVKDDGCIYIQDTEYGEVIFNPDGTVTAEGRQLDPREWTLAGTKQVLPIH